MAAVYVTHIVHYTDDYKARGDDWSTTERPRVFTTREKAEVFVYAAVKERFIDCMDDKLAAKYLLDDKSDFKPEYADYDTLVELEGASDGLFAGEFVPNKLEFNIFEEVPDSAETEEKRKRARK